MSERDTVPEWNEVWMGTSETEDEDGYFPVNGTISTLATATFPAKTTIGDYTKDAEDYLSTLILSDLSGGINIEDMNEGSDTARCWTAFMDIRRPGKIALNTLVEEITPPVGAPTGPAYSCGQIVDTPYFLIGQAGSMKAYGRKESDGTWYAGVAVSPVIIPVGKPVAFAEKLFVPCGTSGYLIISEADSVGSPGVPTITNVTTGGIAYPAAYNPASLDVNPPLAVAFEVFDQKLWALTTGGALAWSFTGADDSWNWPYDEARAWYPRIQSGEDPQNIIGFYNPNGDPHIFVLTDRGGYIYSQSTPPSLVTTPLKFPPHPDNGRAAAVWRAGEDLHVGMGIDSWRYTSANVVVPLSGLARDDGVPQELFGSIYDMEAETSELYCLVGPVQNGSSGYVYSAQEGSAGSGNTNYANVRGLAVDSSGSVFACDTDNERVKELTAAAAYAAQFGSSGTGNGNFAANDGAYDIAVDGSDNLWVVDRGNHRIQKFSNAGVYSSQIDGKVAYVEHAYTSQVGSAGTGDGQFANVRGVTCDSSGNVFACDTDNERIQKFTSALVFDSKFGASGTGNGQFAANDGCYDIDVDGSDNLWVVDRGNHRIQKFNSAGTYQSQIDGTTSVTTWTLQNTYGPTFNSLAISSPDQVAVDSTGRVLIADNGNDRLVILTSAGAYSTGITSLTDITGVCVDSSDNIYVAYDATSIRKYNSSLTLQWTKSYGGSQGAHVTTDGTHLWVADSGSNKVWKRLCSDGTAVSNFGGAGTANGKFGSGGPYGITSDGTHLYVSDPANARVQKFLISTSAYVTQWSVGSTPHGCAKDASGNIMVAGFTGGDVRRYSNTGTLVDSLGGGNWPQGVAMASGDVAWVTDAFNGTITKWDEVTTTTGGSGNGNLDSPEGIAIKRSSGRIYVADTGNDRIEYFTSAGAYEGQWGETGTETGEFTTPVAVAVNQSTGTVYVADQGNDRVQYFTATGTFSGTWGTSGSSDGQFQNITALEVHPTSGNVFVMDSTRDDIQEFTAAGVHISTSSAAIKTGIGILGSTGTGNGQFQGGSGLCFDADGSELYTSDLTVERIQRWTEASTNLPGDGNGNLYNPESLDIKTSSGRVYVADTGNNRIQYFTSAGAYEGKWGSSGTGTSQFNAPTGIAVNQSTGDVYVVDSGNDRVQQFTATGTFVRAWGSTGTGDGQFTTPTVLAIHPTEYTVYVADSTRDDVQIFSANGTFTLKLGSSGTGNGQFNFPSGIAFSATGTSLYVADSTDERVQRFLFSEATSGQTFPWLAAWTGIGWYGKKKFDSIGISPNWMHVTGTSYKYSLYLGLSDGSIHRMALRRYFHNPRRALLAGEDEFEADGEIVTPRFDAAMLGFWKLASHMVVFMDNATTDEAITIEYRTDADNGNWTLLGTVDSTDKTYLPFGEVSEGFSEGVPFNWIQFRIRGERGSDTALTPVIKSMVFCYIKIPQNAHAFNFLVPFPREEFRNRTGYAIKQQLNDLIVSRKFFTLRFADQDGNEQSYRGYLTAISGDDAPSQHQLGQRAVSFIQISDAEVA